ncbi:MAG: hypothetical protein E7672_09020, partial [Ruminococcaceae bacterium]|nr:hypothetical protein [Oscillospiraceae bacterium]
MKKIVSVFVSLLMMMSLTIGAIAAADDFVVSPSQKDAPGLEDFEGDGDLVIVGYGDRDSLTDEQKKEFEDSYDSIRNAEDLSDLVGELKEIAEALGVDTDDLEVSDLFNIILGKNGDVYSDVTISPEVLDNFVALIQYVDGKNLQFDI